MPTLKIVILGAGGVGKSAITVQYIQGVFIKKYDPTIEENFRKMVDVEGKSYMLEILDTAGTEQFTTMRDMYIRKGQGFILVFSLVSKSTFFDLSPMIDQIRKSKDEQEILPLVLVGNKCDLKDKIALTQEQINEFAQQKFNNVYYEASAKTRKNIEEIFLDVSKQIISTLPPKRGGGCILL